MIRNFLTDTSGAVTVDWVVITAAAAAMALIAGPGIFNGIKPLLSKTEANIVGGLFCASTESTVIYVSPSGGATQVCN